MNGILISNAIADLGELLNKFLISLVGGIFKLVNYAYRIFFVLVENNIFNQEDLASITSNIYKILSIVMLFILSYGILNKIVDPDNNKSGIDGKKIFTNFIISIVLITLCPSIFQFAYGFQSAFLNSGIIGGIFTGNTSEVDSIHYGGINMSVNTFLPFFTSTSGDNNNVYGKTDIGVIRAIDPNGSSQEFECSDKDGDEECSLERATNFALETGSFSVFRAFAKNIYEGEIDFDWFAALIVGGFLCYVMISFCFDMGIRVCKLAFYQIIAPIAIFCMIIPKMDDIFKKWLSNVSKTFLSSFTRVFVMNLGVYFISLLVDFNLFGGSSDTGSGFLNLLSKCFLILGIVAFMRQAPKLLSDLFGFADGDMKLGIKDKLKAGGAFAMGAAIGGGATALIRNAVNAGGNIKDAKTGKDKRNAVLKGIGSTIAGGTSGLTKGLWYARGAGSGKDMKAAAGEAANKAIAAKSKREAYKASHPGSFGTIKGHFFDTVDSVAKWAGYNNIEALKKANADIDTISSKKKAIADAAESLIVGEANKNKDKSFGVTSLFAGADNLAKQYDGTFSTAKLRDIRQKMEQAKATGSSKDYYGVDVSASEWEDLYGNYLNAFKEAVQNRALLSDGNWNKIKDTSVIADLSDVRNAANDFRNELGRHLNEEYIAKANHSKESGVSLDATTIKGDLEVTSGAIKALGDQLKIAKSENYAEISKIQEKEKDKNSK